MAAAPAVAPPAVAPSPAQPSLWAGVLARSKQLAKHGVLALVVGGGLLAVGQTWLPLIKPTLALIPTGKMLVSKFAVKSLISFALGRLALMFAGWMDAKCAQLRLFFAADWWGLGQFLVRKFVELVLAPLWAGAKNHLGTPLARLCRALWAGLMWAGRGLRRAVVRALAYVRLAWRQLLDTSRWLLGHAVQLASKLGAALSSLWLRLRAGWTAQPPGRAAPVARVCQTTRGSDFRA